MKINSTLEKRLLKYSAMASGVVAMGVTADAQIVYFDESPDVVITGHQQGAIFDFDSDGNDDILIYTLDNSKTGTFTSSSNTYNYGLNYAVGAVYAYTGAAVLQGSETVDVVLNGGVATVSTTQTKAVRLDNGNAINSSGSFGTGQVDMATIQSTTFTPALSNGLTAAAFAPSAWVGATDKYLGFRFTSAGNLHYGWMRLDVSADALIVTVKDWAYNSTPDGAINAGDMGASSLAENAGELALVRFGNNRVDVKAINGSNGNITIVGMDGKVAYNAAMNSTTESIDLSNMAAGLYIVNAQFSEGAVTHKVVVR